MDITAVETSYARWAPIYDLTFGAVTNAGRKHATAYLTDLGGKVLEVGVGTGLALPFYGEGVQVTGVDYSPEMLAKARTRVASRKLTAVEQLCRMDARDLAFPDNHFDGVAAMHIMSVVPEPERVLAEMARVCKPGGSVVIVNHFAKEKGFVGFLERHGKRFDQVLGWHSDFDKSCVMGDQRLSLEWDVTLPPMGLMTFLAFKKHV